MGRIQPCVRDVLYIANKTEDFGQARKRIEQLFDVAKAHQLERRATTKNNENQSVCDRFSIVYLLYWNFLPRLGKLLNTRSFRKD